MIQRLDNQVINQIAAGEVVERPASVLKELVENAIDAGAKHISIDLEEGGAKLIAVSDDGSGMDRHDAILAVERHATSKIQAIEDLFAIGSMGFRGEALASIAAVSKLTLRTKSKCDGGTELRVIGGEMQPVSDWNGKQGTSILVEDLFFNIPARRQFLRKSTTEYAYCLEYIQALSLSNLDVSMCLKHNGREVFSVQAYETEEYRDRLRRRFGEVLGRPVDDFIWVEKKSRYGEVLGYISPPGQEKPNTRAQYFFVNQRWVKDKVLRYGVQRGYHSHLLKGKHPVLVLQVTMDPGLVDVNVHPAKTELRFQYREEIQNLIAFGLREALRQGAWAGPDTTDLNAERPSSGTPKQEWTQSGSMPDVLVIPPGGSTARTFEFGIGEGGSSGSSFFPTTDLMNSARPPVQDRYSAKATKWGPPQPNLPMEQAFSNEADFGSTKRHEPIPWSQLTYIGAFAKCYLMFERADQLLVVDQHAFHERILFERLCRDQSLLGRSQKLLMPEEISLPADHVAALQELQNQLHSLGFEFKITGTLTVEVSAVPALVTKRDPEELFSALSSAEEREFTLESNAGLNQRLLATMACHAAVRAGEELSENDLRLLLAEASEVDFYHNCPHGRRVFRWWKVSQVAAWFDR